VLIDDHAPGTAHGSDVDDQGDGTVTEQRLYQLIRQPEPVADRVFEIEFLDSGVEAFDFTFGWSYTKDLLTSRPESQSGFGGELNWLP